MSAERKIQTGSETAIEEENLPPFALKEQVAARLAAHRSRRGRPETEGERNAPAPARERTSRIAAAVAERYANSKSYRSFLAEEAERAIRQAEAAAEIARLNAQAVKEAQYDLLDRLEEYAAEPAAPVLLPPSPAPVIETSSASARTRVEFLPEQVELLSPPALEAPAPPAFDPASLTVRLAEDLPQPSQHSQARELVQPLTVDPDEAYSLDEEIAFRQMPVFEPLEPPVDIPGNLIEFPRQLVAAKRARPRLAEGPLRDEDLEHDASQLRIFEVESEQISTVAATEAPAPEWSSILLGAQPRSSSTVDAAAHAHYQAYTDTYSPNLPVEYATAGDRAAQHLEPTIETRHLYAAPFQVAPFSQRLMSAMVDASAVLASGFVFMAVAMVTASHFTPGGLMLSPKEMALAGGVTLFVLSFAYQYLSFTFSDATPGMRYAHIGLCSFSDDNPKRAAMRGRVLALALATAPLGLGLLWALFDEDHLGWHDRISRMYQRSY